jgi:hypothetical protein
MRNDQLQEYLKNFSSESEVRILIDGVYYHLEDVIQGRFFATVELVGPQKISIEQAEGELFTGLYTGNIAPKRLALIEKTLGADRVNLIKKEIEKAMAETEQAQAAVTISTEAVFEEEEEIPVEKPKKKGKKKKLSDEEKLLAYFRGEEELSAEEAGELRKKLGAEKVREIFNKAEI